MTAQRISDMIIASAQTPGRMPTPAQNVLTVFGDTTLDATGKRHRTALDMVESYHQDGFLQPGDPRRNISQTQVILATMLKEDGRTRTAEKTLREALNTGDAPEHARKTLLAMGPWLMGTPEQMKTDKAYGQLGVQAAVFERMGLTLCDAGTPESFRLGQKMLVLAAGSHEEAASRAAGQGLNKGSVLEAAQIQKRPLQAVVEDGIKLGLLTAENPLHAQLKDTLTTEGRDRLKADAPEAWERLTGKPQAHIPDVLKSTLMMRAALQKPEHPDAGTVAAAAIAHRIETETRNANMAKSRNLSKTDPER